MKVESWGDLFKYNKELLEDDYNHGQALVLKSKTKANDNVTVSLPNSSPNNCSQESRAVCVMQK